MKLVWTAVLLMLIAGCGSINEASGSRGTRPTPSPGAKPAVKKELPWLTVPGGQMKTTLFYGPWQCRREFMNQCQVQCAREGYPLMGCVWLADLKFDWKGRLVLLPVDVDAGSRYGIWHCCCNYPKLPTDKKEVERKRWDRFRESFREDWSKKFGEWPSDGAKSWPGHHVRDLQHGGDPVDPNNIFPAKPSVHDLYNRAYPACYGGQPPWNTVGPDLPYTDN
ncbi:hypothetical protein [Melittangium boletus]|uniref:Lipoprotein n=1 Tax=Melittangium boletus DSM 14713 TaxID=1294270 RepID=A0A250IIR9_9BACT|nr:hypothetical protein [Melittangium boletus]ATB31719.1 hypothetical protein MEBOL_005182 [Melittangium boletus DSM 14713]